MAETFHARFPDLVKSIVTTRTQGKQFQAKGINTSCNSST